MYFQKQNFFGFNVLTQIVVYTFVYVLQIKEKVYDDTFSLGYSDLGIAVDLLNCKLYGK